MSVFNRGNNGRVNRGRGNWNMGPRMPRFSIHLMYTRKSWDTYFKMDFLTRLGKEWSKIGQEGLPSKPHMSLVSQFPLMSHYNLKSLKTMDGKRLSTQ
jgi:hypothetical protein